MPIYEYQCSKCHHGFETIQRVNDIPLIECPKCNENSLFKLISPAGAFILKGEGFYKPSEEV